MPKHGIYKTITLSGSTKFKEEFEKVAEKLSAIGNIVLTLHEFTGFTGYVPTKEEIDLWIDMHFQRINMADAIVVINKNQYIGKSTFDEIVYSFKNCKSVYFIEPVTDEQKEFLHLDKYMRASTLIIEGVEYCGYHQIWRDQE